MFLIIMSMSALLLVLLILSYCLAIKPQIICALTVNTLCHVGSAKLMLQIMFLWDWRLPRAPQTPPFSSMNPSTLLKQFEFAWQGIEVLRAATHQASP